MPDGQQTILTFFLDVVELKQTGDLGTDTLAHLSHHPLTQWGIFCINKDNNQLITLDPFAFMNLANAYTDSPEGAELKFTFYNNTSRPNGYYWPKFDIVDGWLTADGKKEAFGYCPFQSSTGLTGSIVIGKAGIGAEGCRQLEGLQVDRATSLLRIE
ncbi:hypothetical protein BJX63DRAFT_437592 [Aspergillus granulosus]|uniref:Uncharacterized protein n=1 Tax=Aspergillus granulosus TaxID=176169 RepID=A0ABR4GUK1_9EURO